MNTEELNYQLISSYMFNLISYLKAAQAGPTLRDPMDHTVHGIFQAIILEWVAVLFSSGSSRTRNQTRVSCIAGRFFTSQATREAQLPPKSLLNHAERIP